jgi:hypothetical protein
MATLPWPWPVRAKTKIAERGPATVFAEPTGNLSVRIDGGSRIFEFESCPLILEGQTSTNIGFSWALPNIANMIVGKTIVLSNEQPEIVPREARIQSGVSNDRRDFTKDNTDALLKRRDRLASSRASKKLKPTFRETTNAEIFDALQKTQVQISDLLTLVKHGKLEHVDGLLRLLRLTITDKKDKSMPLLQLCAAMIAAPLIVYAPPINAFMEPLPMDGLETIAASITSTPTDFCKNPIDLDFWLASRGAQVEGKVLTQKNLIENIANSVASHFDIFVRPETDMLHGWKSEIAGVDADFIVHYTVAISTAVNDVISSILAARPS